MANEALLFEASDLIGRVAAVDTSRIIIDVENQELVTRIGVGNLIAVKGATEMDFHIGLTERITRSVKEGVLPTELVDTEEITLESKPSDAVRVVVVGSYRTVDGAKRNVFKRGSDTSPQVDRECFLIQGGNLQSFMGLLSADLKDDEKLQLGHFAVDQSAAAIANGDRFFQRHASILGSTGSGKSWAVALLLEKAAKLKHPNIIVLDMHGEYTPLTKAKGGYAEGFRIAGPGDLTKPGANSIFLPYWLLNRDEMLSMILDRSDQNAPNQASRFTLHIRSLKEKTLDSLKKADVKATFTVDSPVPFALPELISLLNDDDVERVAGAKDNTTKAGEWAGKLTRFILRLRTKVSDRRYGFMFQPPKEAMEYDWLATVVGQLLGSNSTVPGIKIIDFSEVPSDVLPVVTGTFARLLYDIQFWMDPAKRTPFALICDEAHLYLPIQQDADAVERQALETFERIAKEGRKYGCSLVVVSQRPSDVSRTILSQCNNFLVLRLTNDSDQQVVRRLMPDSMAGVTDILPLLDTGEALLLGDSILLPTRIRLDKPVIRPDSGTRDFWSDWVSKQPDDAAIKEAVETLRRQTRNGAVA
jgi:DNA helicase HerA-like ATPase